MSSISAIILAAGASTRMGTPKQLLLYRGKTLLRSIVESAIEAACHPIFVVLGAHFDLTKEELRNLPIVILENQQWQTGMGSSIRLGIQAVIDISANSETSIDATILLLCDQPFVSAEIIDRLQNTYRTVNKSVAATYGNTIGVPALFRANLFSELASLDRSMGAKSIIQRHLDSIATINFPQGAIDLDTPEDYQQIANISIDL